MSDIQSEVNLSRQNSSSEYVALLNMYKDMHKISEGMFNGRSLLKFVAIIKAYLENNNCKSILDYGYLIRHMKNILNFLSIKRMLLFVLMSLNMLPRMILTGL